MSCQPHRVTSGQPVNTRTGEILKWTNKSWTNESLSNKGSKLYCTPVSQVTAWCNGVITPDSQSRDTEFRSWWNLLCVFSLFFFVCSFCCCCCYNTSSIRSVQHFSFFLHTCLCVNTNIIKNSLELPFLCKFVDLRQTVDLSVYFIDTFCCWLLRVLCLFICFVVFCLFVCCHKFLLLSVFPSSFLQIYVYTAANESQSFVKWSKSKGVRVAGSRPTPCTPPWWSWRPRTSCCRRRTRMECGRCLSTWRPTAQTATLRRSSAS